MLRVVLRSFRHMLTYSPELPATLQFESSGIKEQIEADLTSKLTDCGWRDKIKAKCVEFIEQRGKDNLTTEELVHLVAPGGRASVPDALKADMLTKMKDFVQGINL
jgi:enhancer of yellow 2 transcription factor